MGDYTDNLAGKPKRVLKRGNLPDLDLMEFREKTPEEALALLSAVTQVSIVGINPIARLEIGQTLLGFADALSRVVPPAVRLDFAMGTDGGWLSELTINGEPYKRRAIGAKQALSALCADSLGCVARYASGAVPKEVTEREEAQAKVLEQWAANMRNVAIQLEAVADLTRSVPPPETSDDAESG